jgi:hypothetical protein
MRWGVVEKFFRTKLIEALWLPVKQNAAKISSFTELSRSLAPRLVSRCPSCGHPDSDACEICRLLFR